MIELAQIADVRRQIITPRMSTPIIGIVQDGVLGAYNLTDSSMRISWKDVMNIMSYTTIDSFKAIKKNKEYTGQEVFSLIIPDKINSDRKGLMVENGEIAKGQLSKQHLGDGKDKSLIHLIWNEYGFDEAKRFIDNTQRLVNNFNMLNGFTVGIGDINIPAEITKQLKQMFETKKLEIDHMITSMENNPDMHDMEVFERNVNGKLNSVLGDAEKVVMSALSKENKFRIMIESGAKGKTHNMAQMGGCIGQTAVEGKRVKKKLNGRTLSCFAQNDDSATARGFIDKSFFEGMDPVSFIFHNMGSREGLIDTAIKTATSGYIQRKLIKSMEDAHVTYDMSVRTSTAGVLQFYYGGNGIDTTKQYKHTLGTLHMGNKELSDMLKLSTKELKNHPYKDNDKFYKEFLGLRDEMRDAIMALSHNRVKMEKDFMIPVNLDLILTTVRNETMKSDGKLKADYIYDQIHEILKYENTLLTAMSKKEAKDSKSIKVRDELIVKTLLKFAMYQYFAPKRCIVEYGLNKAQFDAIVKRIISEFNESVVHPGEMVGVLAAQSIGEPVTQLSSLKKERIPAKIIDSSGNTCYHTGAIGDLVDYIFEKQCEQQRELGKDSIVGIPDCKLYISTVNRDTEKQEWKRVSEVSRHPANGKMCKITTKTGRSTVTTLTHSHLQRTEDGKIIPKVAKDLKVGDYIPVVKQMNTHGKVIREVDGFDLDFENGWFVGAYLSEGNPISTSGVKITNKSDHFERRVKAFAKRHGGKYTRKESSGKILPNYPEYDSVEHNISGIQKINKLLVKHCGKGSKNKSIPCFALFAPEEFVSGLLRGYFDGDGNINGQRQLIRVHSISQQLLEGIALLLSRFGIFATFGTEKKNRKNPLHTLKILRKYAKVFKDKIGTDFTEKANQLKMIIDYNNGVKSSESKCDMIPMMGKAIADAAKPLKLPGYSRNYKRWLKKPAVGRDTLEKYYNLFSERLEEDDYKNVDIKKELKHMKQVIDNDIVWDPIKEIEVIDDPNELVYDLSVEGNHTFMMLNGIFVHNTLNTFHSAGIGAKGTTTLGTTRMSELMSFSKNMKTPQMLIYMTEEFNKNKAMAEKIASSIKYTTIGDIRDKAEVFWDPDPFNDEGYVKKDNVFNIFYSHRPSRNSCQQEITGLPWLLRIHLNKEQMMDKNITLLDIKSRFCNHWEKRYTDPKSVKKDQRKYIEKIGSAAIVSNSDNDETPIIHIRFSMNTYNYELITGFVETIVDNFTLKGIDTIEGVEGVETDVVVKYDSEDQNVETEKQQVIYTKGADLVAIRYLKGVDLLKTSTNNVVQIYNNFGIEAARISILREINKVFESSNINYQHIGVLIDTMTQTGGLTSIDRHGLHKLDTDPLARASFEKQVDQFLQAAVFGESDHMDSVSSRIMGGLAIKGGTGLCNVVLDVNMLQNSEYIEGQDVGYDKGFTELETDNVVEDIVEKKEETNVWMPL